MINVGLIGFGYWGPNIARNLNTLRGVRLAAISEISHEALSLAKASYPTAALSGDYREITDSEGIDAVAIATPVVTHFEMAARALENGKHIFVEKPFTRTSREALRLIDLAAKKKLTIMVGHTFLFSGAVRRIKQLMEGQALGKVYYYDARRVNLGLFQHDVNVVWDLAPHDFSIMDHLLKKTPSAITANGMGHFSRGFEDVAYVTAYFNDNMIAHFNVNWLSPVKIRSTYIGGERKMLVWNDLEADEKIKIYDKGVRIDSKQGVYKLLVEYRSGDVWSPKTDHTEALKLELEHFRDCVLNHRPPLSDGHAGLRIVRMLEASSRSLKNNGKMVKL